MSQQPPNTELLDIPISHLLLSKDFKATTKLLGFSTLREITQTNKKKLFDHQHFTIFWWDELLAFMKGKNLLHLMNR